MINPTSPKAAEAQPSPVSPNAWDRMTQSWAERPGYYLGLLIVAGILVTGGVLGWQAWQGGEEAQEIALQDEWNAALQLPTAIERADGFAALESRFADSSEQAFYLFSLARLQVQAATEAESQARKLSYYNSASDTIGKIASARNAGPLTKMPWRPDMPGQTEAPLTPVASLQQHVEQQLAFLNAHEFPAPAAPDEGLEATLELAGPDGKSGKVVLHFFSVDAPNAVENFLNLAREGWYADMPFHAVEVSPGTQDQEAETVSFGSAMARVAPERSELWLGEKDVVGYTLPIEGARIPFEKGRVAFEVARVDNAASPVRIVVAVKDTGAAALKRSVFAEVVEGLPLLEELSRAPRKDEPLLGDRYRRHFPLDPGWKIVGITITGEPKRRPDAPITLRPRMPETPEPLEKEAPEAPDEGPAPSKEEPGDDPENN